MERIDEVRCITNHSTGAMGSAVAEAFLRLVQTEEIIYICGAAAIAPRDTEKVRILRVTDVSDLQKTLRRVLTEEKVDGAVHCMAVSDYTVDAVTSAEFLKSRLTEGLMHIGGGSAEISARLPALLDGCLHADGEIAAGGKISSELDDLILVLKRTPKIIDMFKALQPRMVLLGFKLLNHVTADALIEAGVQLMKRSGCDFVFANDKAEVTPERHCGYLIRPAGSFERLSGRAKIAAKIVSCVADKIIREENS